MDTKRPLFLISAGFVAFAFCMLSDAVLASPAFGLVWSFDVTMKPIYTSLQAILGFSKMVAALSAVVGTAWCAFEWGGGDTRPKSFWLSWMLALFMALGSTIIIDALVAVTVGKIETKVKTDGLDFPGVNTMLPSERQLYRELLGRVA